MRFESREMPKNSMTLTGPTVFSSERGTPNSEKVRLRVEIAKSDFPEEKSTRRKSSIEKALGSGRTEQLTRFCAGALLAVSGFLRFEVCFFPEDWGGGTGRDSTTGIIRESQRRTNRSS